MLFSKTLKKKNVSVEGILSTFYQAIEDLEELSVSKIEEAREQRVISIVAQQKERDAIDESNKASAVAIKLNNLISE